MGYLKFFIFLATIKISVIWGERLSYSVNFPQNISKVIYVTTLNLVL